MTLLIYCLAASASGSTASALASVSKATASVSNPSASASVSGILPWSQHWTSVVLQNFFLCSDYEYRVKYIKSIINNEDTEGLSAPCEIHKFVDDTTLSELIPPSHTRTDMANYLTSLLTWTAENDMQLRRYWYSIDARYWYSNSVHLSVRPSVCLSVRLSVRDTLVLYENG